MSVVPENVPQAFRAPPRGTRRRPFRTAINHHCPIEQLGAESA
ncbi:hypothetical protein ACTWJ8_35060 [Streptomyces sp. SDT5-1]